MSRIKHVYLHRLYIPKPARRSFLFLWLPEKPACSNPYIMTHNSLASKIPFMPAMSITFIQLWNLIKTFVNNAPCLRGWSLIFQRCGHLVRNFVHTPSRAHSIHTHIYMWFHVTGGFSRFLAAKLKMPHTANSTPEFLMNWLLNVNALFIDCNTDQRILHNALITVAPICIDLVDLRNFHV